MNLKKYIIPWCIASITITSCTGKYEIKMGTYAYDALFLKEHGIEYKELVSEDGNAKIMIVPKWQGRVMTTTASGNNGDSYGWINYRFIKEGKINKQFNPVGGEERFWLGPEGGPFSLYFKEGEKQIYNNWHVPSVIDTEAYEIKSENDNHIRFTKNTQITNASGTVFLINIDRTVSLMDVKEIISEFGIEINNKLKIVAYKSENKITNIGKNKWDQENGLISIWMLSHFNPTATTTVFIPYSLDSEKPIVNDEYFGKIPSDRLISDNGVLYFKIDGKYRSKLGIPSGRAKGICGSYDSSKQLLTILKCDLPNSNSPYVNGQWGDQKDPFSGDVINAYNDGPLEDGSIMGPFYEIETSSPGAELSPGESLTHRQQIIHLQGNETDLNKIINKVFGTELDIIKNKFQ